MAHRILEITLISASDFKKVALFSRMRVYAVASISGADSRMPTHGTDVDRDGGQNHVWNTALHFSIPADTDTRCLALHVLLRSEASALFLGHLNVGEVFVPIRYLLADGGGSEHKTMGYQVCGPLSGCSHGVLHFSYKFKADSSIAAADAQVIAYPPSEPALVYQPIMPYRAAYPPQLYEYASLPSPPYVYNAAPPPAMYGYAAPLMVLPARQKGGTGMGLGLGLLGDAVGGMMLSDMMADFEADAGFNDGLGF